MILPACAVCSDQPAFISLVPPRLPLACELTESTGVQDFCAYVTTHSKPGTHVITANEGGAIALGTGYYLATKQFPLIYLQNSGLGNAVNPLMSLAHPEVYRFVESEGLIAAIVVMTRDHRHPPPPPRPPPPST